MTKPTPTVWPDDVAACQALLTAMSSNNAFLLAALEATKDTVQGLEQQTLSAESAFGTVEVKEFVKSQKSLSVQQVVRQLVQPNAL